MAPKGLNAFFKPVAKGLPAATPAATAASSDVAVAPAAPQAPKRAASAEDNEPDIKAKRLKDDAARADVAMPDSLVGATAAPAGGDPLLAPTAQQAEKPTDLRAALQHAQKGRGLPAFTAECLHHFTVSGTTYQWPTWLRPENLCDQQGKKPGEEGFDPCTLWIPSEKVQKDEGHGTPMLLQYWQVKKDHFDKVAFFKVGKFYEIFYYDAFIAQHVCDLKWMNNEKKPHVGFPEVAKAVYAKKLIELGYKVVVVEQTERVEENKQKAQETGGPASGTCIERKACEVFTKGTVVDPELIGGAKACFLVYFHFEEGEQRQGGGSVARRDTSFAACLIDCATSQISVGRVQDGPDRNALRTLLAQIQPSEVVYASANLPNEVSRIFRNLPCRPVQSSLRSPELTPMVANGKLASYRKAHPDKLTAAIEGAIAGDRGISVTIAAAGALEYLEDVLLSSRVLPFAVWGVLESHAVPQETGCSSTIGKRMVLDATALSALEILETLEGTYKGSLLHYLDHTSTPFGFRFLKQWLCAPLLDVDEIKERREAIEFFIANQDVASKLRTGLKALEVDLERATSRVWGYALQNERQAVMYADVTAKRLRDFSDLLQAYDKSRELLTETAGQALPQRLLRMTKTRSAGGVFPDLKEVIDRLRGSVVTMPGKKEGSVKYRPRDGADPQYDAITKEIANAIAALEKELRTVRAKFPGVELKWIHRQPGFRYEIEMDDNAIPEKQILQSMELTSRSKSKVRFQSAKIKDLVVKLDVLENRHEDCIWPFLSKLFQEFYAHQSQFRSASRIVAEMDALLSLAMSSQGLPGTSCAPEFVDVACPTDRGTLELRGCSHPVAADKMGAAFVPNDTLLNACEVPGVLIVTGPNMGGKSTVLRQTCLAVVMAQLGCRVSAAKCRLTPVDRIFTRIGSYDTILEGKSTLLTELEETATVLAHGTPRSLAVLDELGRGTSTFDGAAIAAAVLEEIANKVGCLTLFATHYHPVSREAAQWKHCAPYHMAARLDEVTSEMTFLYRFLPGLCPSSHGHNVARLAGLPTQVVKEGAAKSAEFERGTEAKASMTAKAAAHDFAELGRLAELGDVAALQNLFRQTRAVAAASG